VQLPPFSCYFIPPRSRYSPQHPVLTHHSLCSSLNRLSNISRLQGLTQPQSRATVDNLIKYRHNLLKWRTNCFVSYSIISIN
jgi:hypothetical protein